MTTAHPIEPLVQKARAAATRAREDAAKFDSEDDWFLAVGRADDARHFDRIAAQMEAGGPAVDVELSGYLTPQSAGWKRAWASIAEQYGDVECRCPETGEVWQYMGSANGEHQFRHRSLRGERVCASVPAVAGDFEIGEAS